MLPTATSTDRRAWDPGQAELDDALAEHARAEAATAGTTLSDRVRAAIRHQVALATALRARAEEDARAPLYSEAEEDALLAARIRRAHQAFDDPSARDTGPAGLCR